MKCPNCGKEALFVNGKYVCVDCGIEITPEQQAIQNQASAPVLEPATPSVQTESVIPDATPEVPVESAPAEVAPVVSSTEPEPTADVLPSTEPTPEPATPVKDYFENALASSDEAEKSTPVGAGVYDFTNEPESATTEVPASEPIPVMPEPLGAAPSPEITTPEAVAVPTPEVAPAQPENYFAPATFDMAGQATQPNDQPMVEPVASEQTPETFNAPEPLVSPAPVTEEVPNMTQPEPPTQSLDDMLGAAPVSAPLDSSPVSAYGPSVDGVGSAAVSADTINATPTESANPMPSVESVFGNSPTPPVANNDLPTAQDFGVAPPAPKQKKKIWPIVAAVVGGLVLVGGLATVLILNANRSKTVEPVVMTDADIISLSNGVSSGMQAPQDMSVTYNLTADFFGLTVKDTGKEGDLYRDFFKTPLTTSGTWSSDTEGNVTLDALTNEVQNKRTYMSEESATYIYSTKDNKYTQKSGLQLTGIPSIYGAEEKAATFYTTNVKSGTYYGKETIDGADYLKYELVPSEELVSSMLESLNSIFSGVTYQSLVTDQAKITAWVSSEGKIKKVVLSGEISLETDKFSGKLTLSGEANYSYQDVTIIKPTESSGSAPTTDATPTEASQKTTNNEEGQTSSVNSSETPAATEEPLVEAKG